MKKYSLFFISIILLCTSCARDNLYEDALMGTWISISSSSDIQITLIIKPSGSYSTSGYLGNVSGTWKLSKRNLTFYTGEQEYMRCYVTELWWDYCELQITLDNETIHTKFKCDK